MAIALTSCKTMSKTDMTRDPEMEMGIDAGQNFRNYVQSIREAANPAASAKSNGGCGCN